MENFKRGTIPMQDKLKLSKSDGASTPAEKRRMSNVPYASNPGELHWTNVKNILKYFQNTKDVFLVYGDAEYITVFDASKEAVWIHKFISGLNVVPTIEEPITMYYDNTRTIAIANDHEVTKDDNLADLFTKALAFPKHSELTRKIGLIPASSLMQVRVLLDVSIASMNADCYTNSQVGAVGKLSESRGIDHLPLLVKALCNAVVLDWILSSLSQDVYLGHVFFDNAANEILPEAKDAFVIISREESYMGIPTSSVKSQTDKAQSSAFVSKTNGNNDVKTSGGYVSLTNDQVMKLMSLLNDKGGFYANSHMDLKKEKVLGTGRESVGLYLFDSDYASSAMCSDIYGKEPNLSHLRSFGCLCFATVVKGSNKFSYRFEKCVLIGYASGKKAYKLFNLENRSVLYSRDVKFYENVFPYKMNKNEEVSESENINFFDHFDVELETKTSILSPNDEEEGSPGRDGKVHQPVTNANTDQPRHDETHLITPVDKHINSEGNVDTSDEVLVFQINFPNTTEEVSLRKSQRTSKLPAKLNECVLDNKVKYGLNKYANHCVLSSKNYSFVCNLNKSVVPSSFEEALKDIN
ncbi:ribonuclease H-like domain-containing protein [Tanacetum coccineum]|uniref:Ribonuclease H-like domain-containing protein n=1 Tax=Tanacetum coccineum TaxID=301880 RepID=A0ABQ4ZNY7_9ASTR